MVFFGAAIRKDLIALLIYTFHSHAHFYLCATSPINFFMHSCTCFSHIFVSRLLFFFVVCFFFLFSIWTYVANAVISRYTRIIKYVSRLFFVWALLLLVHTSNSSLLPSNLLRLQCTFSTVPTTSSRLHGSPLVWACQWPSSQPLSSPQLSHIDSLWA